MTGTAKVWDGSAWDTIPATPGPQGPAGVMADDSFPRGPAGGGLNSNYPNPGVNRAEAGTLLAVQRDWGRGTTTIPIAIGANFMSSGSTPMRISYTPTRDCWWMVDAYCVLQKTDAAYHYSYLALWINPLDSDGFGGSNPAAYAIGSQNANVMSWLGRNVRMVFNLYSDPPVTFVCTMTLEGNGGTWQYNQQTDTSGPGQTLFLTGKVFAK